MSKAPKLPTRGRLRELFTYCQESGQLIWKVDRGPTAPAGAVAGSMRKDQGTWCISVDGKLYTAHALVWKYVKGRNPPMLVHINGHRDDNRIENLRPLKGSTPWTLKRIEEKCELVGDCWHWRAGKSGKAPALRHNGKIFNARNFIFTKLLGRTVHSNRMVTMSCDNLDCVAPNHLIQVTRQQLQQRTAKRTKYGASLVRRAKLSAAKRAASPYPDEFIEQVRAMEGTCKGIARELGLCASTVTDWRNRDTRKPLNSPFAGLLAA